jgi:hypothetical protein
MSTLVAKNLQVGADGTASNNFTIYQPAAPDGTLRIGNGNTGTTSAQVVLTSAGNVGIGTSSPAYPLTVGNNKQIGGLNTAGAGVTFAIVNGSNNLVFGDDSVNTGTLTIQSRSNMIFSLNAAERMRVDSAGNVGIGTSSPDEGKLTVDVTQSGATPTALALSNLGTGAGTGARLTFLNRTGDANQRSEIIGSGTSINNSILAFLTEGDNVVAERMRITSAGRVGISVTSPSFLLELPNVASDAGGRGRANQWATYSDGRIKSNREALSYGLDAVMQLEPLKYFQHNSKTNEDGELEILDEGAESIGLVAQDVAAIIPEIVSVPEDLNKDLCSMDYAKLTTVLVNAIQEQQAIINDLKARLDAANL